MLRRNARLRGNQIELCYHITSLHSMTQTCTVIGQNLSWHLSPYAFFFIIWGHFLTSRIRSIYFSFSQKARGYRLGDRTKFELEIIQILTRRRKVWSTWKTRGIKMGFKSQAVEVKRKKNLKCLPAFST